MEKIGRERRSESAWREIVSRQACPFGKGA
jgi:hypothetical protein